MKSLVFALDLDGTLMHSRRLHQLGDVCVERINGEERGFVRPDVINALKKISNTSAFIPITSRSIKQYRRIEWPAEIKPKLAFVDNGAILLTEMDTAESLCAELLKDNHDVLSVLADRLGADPSIKESKLVDGVYALGILHDDRLAEFDIQKYATHHGVHGCVEGRKVYFFPDGIDKGMAVDRIRTYCPERIIISAGNGANDQAMLAKADFAIGTNQNMGFLHEKSVIYPDESKFESYVAMCLELLVLVDYDMRKWGEHLGMAV